MDMSVVVPSSADATREGKTDEDKKCAINEDENHREGDVKAPSKTSCVASAASFFTAPQQSDCSASRAPSTSSSSSSTLGVRRSVEAGDKGRRGKKGGSENLTSCPACPPPFVRSQPEAGSSLYSVEALRLTIPPVFEGQPQVPSSVGASTPSLCRRGPRSLPRSIKDSASPLAKWLHQRQQDNPEFRDAVARQQASLLPYVSCFPEELKVPITEYFCSANATHLFHYLREDLLRDRPVDLIQYIADWIKRYRSLFDATPSY